MESKEQIYKELVKEAKSANAKLQQLRGNFGEQYGWAGKRLIDKLSIDAVNTVSDKGYIRFNKNLSTVQMKATLKAIKEFKSSKTSTVKGVKENIENVKSGIGSSLDVDNKTAQVTTKTDINTIKSEEMTSTTPEFAVNVEYFFLGAPYSLGFLNCFSEAVL